MLKFITFCLYFSIIPIPPAFADHCKDFYEESQQYNHTVLKIVSDNGHGSGVVISPPAGVSMPSGVLIVTAKHVIENVAEVYVQIGNEKHRALRLSNGHYTENASADIAILLVTDESLHLHVKPIKIADGVISGKSITIGYPGGNDQGHLPVVNVGEVRFLVDTEVITSNCVSPGQSGGALISENNVLIGIISSFFAIEGMHKDGTSKVRPIANASEHVSAETILLVLGRITNGIRASQ